MAADRIIPTINLTDIDLRDVTRQPIRQETFQASAQPVLESLRSVFDPEIPVNVVDLGLIYQCQTLPLEEGGQRVEIKMSMTAPGCGMADMLKEAVRARVQAIPGVSQVEVEIVWEPPWDQSRMSDAARLQLGLL